MPATLQPSPEQDRAENRATLQGLIAKAARIADLVADQAQAAAARTQANQPAPLGALSLDQATVAFDRIARVVRRAIALADHLARLPLLAAPAHDPIATRTRIIRATEDSIHHSQRMEMPFTPAKDRHDYDALYTELHQRIDRPEFDQEFATRPVQDVIDEITRDLRVWTRDRNPSPRRRTPNDLANLKARAERAPLPHPDPGPRKRPRPPNPDPKLDPELVALCLHLAAEPTQKPPRT